MLARHDKYPSLPVQRELQRLIHTPVDELFARPKKSVRSQLVELGYRLLHGSGPLEEISRQNLMILQGVVEAIHGGSIVVDDIQDGSLERRGGPSLHVKYGMPLALNVGNWLYFHALHQVSKMSVSAEVQIQIHQILHESMLEAHEGQALDLGANVFDASPEEIVDIVLKNLELKTGALMAMALQVGAALGSLGSSSSQNFSYRYKKIKEFGRAFGVALQMFDDVAVLDKISAKQLEDLQLRRPTWLWACLVTDFPDQIPVFKQALSAFPQRALIERFFANVPLKKKAYEKAEIFMSDTLQIIFDSMALDSQSWEAVQIQALSDKVRKAYV